VQGLHVAGVWCRAVERLGCDLQTPPGQLGQRRVFQVGQTRLGRQEQVPQSGGSGLDLQFLDDRRNGVVVRTGLLAVLVVISLGRKDIVVDEFGQSLVLVAGFG
jgi:hypothetical protein